MKQNYPDWLLEVQRQAAVSMQSGPHSLNRLEQMGVRDLYDQGFTVDDAVVALIEFWGS